MKLAKDIIDEMTGCASMGTVETGTPMLVGATRPKKPFRVKRKPSVVKECMTGDVAPVLVGLSPRTFDRLKNRTNKAQKKNKAAVESILGESDEDLIPGDATEIETTGREDVEIDQDARPSELAKDTDGQEDLLQPSLALVAPDTTPNTASELDPALVPNVDPALDTLLGVKTGSRLVQPEKPADTDLEVDTTVKAATESVSQPEELPSGDMPRPPGQFLRPIGQIGESRDDAPKVELVVGSNTSVVGSGHVEGELGVSSMPQPQEGNISKTMDVFRRFSNVHRNQ